jgi:hypothetical protein
VVQWGEDSVESTEAHLLLNSGQQKLEYELEAIELTTAATGACDGVKGVRVSFDQH